MCESLPPITGKDRAQFLDRFIYPLPNPLDTRSQYDQYIHADLACMTPLELHRELGLVKLRLLLEERPRYWLHERDAALREALHVRRERR
jgi:hypothetical protein